VGAGRATTRNTRADPLDDPFDDAALAGGIAPLEDDGDPLARFLQPELQLDQFALEPLQLALVRLAVRPLRVCAGGTGDRRLLVLLVFLTLLAHAGNLLAAGSREARQRKNYRAAAAHIQSGETRTRTGGER
jgi:hypothetical protein